MFAFEVAFVCKVPDYKEWGVDLYGSVEPIFGEAFHDAFDGSPCVLVSEEFGDSAFFHAECSLYKAYPELDYSGV